MLLISKNHLIRVLRISKRILAKLIFLAILIFIIYDLILSIYFEKISLASDDDYKNQTLCDELEVHFVDVGQGDGTVILYKDKVIVIDAGPMLHRFKMRNYLQKLGIKRINALIITHPHQDHFGGIDTLLCNFKVDRIYTTEITSKVDKSLTEKFHLYKYNYIISKYNLINDYKKISVVKKDNISDITIEDLTLKFIAPDHVYENFNNNSLVLRLDYKDTSVLFTGDIESEAESDLIKNYQDELSVDVLKIPHHGSKTSSTEEFLDTVNPKMAVISCGYKNSCFHPHSIVVERLEERGISLYRTDEQGTIILKCDGESITANTEEGDYTSGVALSS